MTMDRQIMQAVGLVAFAAFILNQAWKHKASQLEEVKEHRFEARPEDNVKVMGLLPEGISLTLKDNEGAEAKFIRDIAHLAVEESGRVDGEIPASLIVAQAILESNYGKSRLAKKANNYFGHKWRGKGGWILVNDDAPNERFTKFDSRWHSFRAHTNLLMSSLYKGRLKGKPTLENWLDALCGDSNTTASKKFVRKGGRVYATACYNSCYACKIRGIVKQWDLEQLDIIK